MSSDERPHKRLRDSEEGSAASPDVIKQSDEFWIPDGNIVLIAGGTAFRVYKGLLTLQSTVFADLFASSSPRAEESYDGCPLIRLMDSPQDLAHLLRVLLPTSRTFFHRRKADAQITFDEVSAIIRLTHKYHIEDLLAQALSSLQESIKTTFKSREDDSIVSPIEVDDFAAIAVVNLARLTDTPSLLPVALYKCCSLGGAIVDGWIREDESVEYLSPADLKRCINGRNALAKEAFSIVSAIFDATPSMECKIPKACEAAIRVLLSEAFENDGVADSTVLDSWAEIIRGYAQSQDDDGFCEACETELIARDLAERERVWIRLPEIFGVEVLDWNKDEDEDEADGDGDNDDADLEHGGN